MESIFDPHGPIAELLRMLLPGGAGAGILYGVQIHRRRRAIKNGNPIQYKKSFVCPLLDRDHLIPPADRKLIHDLIQANKSIAEVFGARDPDTDAFRLLVILQRIEKNTRRV